MKTYYMHTIEGRPAFWCDRSEQIVYADVAHWKGDRVSSKVRLRASLAQIREDQERSRANRRAWNFNDDAGKYGYTIVHVPTDE